MTSSDSSTCIFPGCTRSVPRGSSPGRPPQYCDLPEHTRWRAWKERQRQAQVADNAEEAARTDQDEKAAAPASGQGSEPVTLARLRADDLLTRFAVQAEQLNTTLEAATEAFSTMSDPAAAEAQVEAARLTAARQVSEADSARLEAENRRREAEAARRTAEETTASAVAATQDAERIAEESLHRRDAAEAERDRQADLARVAVGERDAAVVEANAGLAAAEHRITETAERARADLELERAESASRLGRATEESERLRAELTEQARLRDEAELAERSALARAEQAEEQARRDAQALEAERTRFGADLERAHQRVESDRAAAEAERARLTAELDRLATDRERLAAELDTQRRNAELTLAEVREAAAARLAVAEEARDRALERAERAERAETAPDSSRTAGP